MQSLVITTTFWKESSLSECEEINDQHEAKAAGDRERGWHYEKAGFRYYFPQLGNTFLGFAIKSHSIKAEYLEFSIGVRL